MYCNQLSWSASYLCLFTREGGFTWIPMCQSIIVSTGLASAASQWPSPEQSLSPRSSLPQNQPWIETTQMKNIPVLSAITSGHWSSGRTHWTGQSTGHKANVSLNYIHSDVCVIFYSSPNQCIALALHRMNVNIPGNCVNTCSCRYLLLP